MLTAGRAEDALKIVTNARDGGRRSPFETPKLNQVHVDCLDALGRGDEARELLWQEFCQNLSADSLRQHLRRLPDFEDIEAEDRARTLAMTHPDMDLSRFGAAPSARLSHLAFEGDRTFPAQC